MFRQLIFLVFLKVLHKVKWNIHKSFFDWNTEWEAAIKLNILFFPEYLIVDDNKDSGR